MDASSQILDFLLAAVQAVNSGRSPIAQAYHPLAGTASPLTGAIAGLSSGAVPGTITSALQALVSGALPGVNPGALPVISPTEVLPPTTDAIPSTTTIKVIVRHSKACKDEYPGLGQDYKDCECRKSLYIYENGKDRIISARTRSWQKAEEFAQQQRDERDPIKQRLKELEHVILASRAALTTAQAATTMTIEEATDLWRSTKAKEVSAESTARTHKAVVKRIRGWAQASNIRSVAEMTRVSLDKWRGEWGPNAIESYSRMDSTTQSKFQGYLKHFFDYAVDLGCIEKNPVAKWKGIPEACQPAQPLTPEQFNDLLAAIQPFCASEPGYVRAMAAEFRALFLLQRWAGLRILDALVLPRSGLIGNRISLTTIKTGAVINGRVLPDYVAEELAALSRERKGFKKAYFFWREGIAQASLTSVWTKSIMRMNAFLHLIDDREEPMLFHSHMLRDTCAVELLLRGVLLDQVSKFLTHESTRVTEKHYTPWVSRRLEKLEIDYVAAMRASGVTVSIGK